LTLQRMGIAGQVRQVILDRILNGTYQPGARLIELQIARELGTSQTPVREALRGLEAARLVETKGYCGTRVRSVSAQEMSEAFYVRGALEEAAAGRAAGKLAGNAKVLRTHLQAMLRAAKDNDQGAYTKNNLAFHRAIVEASGNRILLQTWDGLAMDSWVRIRVSQLAPTFRRIAARHRPIIDALERGDGREAGRLLREHAHSFMPEEMQEVASGTGATAAGDRPTSATRNRKRNVPKTQKNLLPSGLRPINRESRTAASRLRAGKA
jgi:DNA-binding GntR family transcriptional regulator